MELPWECQRGEDQCSGKLLRAGWDNPFSVGAAAPACPDVSGRALGEALTAPMGWELSKRRQESLESWSRGAAGHRQHMNRSLARALGEQKIIKGFQGLS